jgi:hypothetical protein
MPDIVTLDDMPSDLDVDDRIRWLNANVEGMIEARLPWRDQIIQSFPIYLNNPMGLGYNLHDAYLNGSVKTMTAMWTCGGTFSFPTTR